MGVAFSMVDALKRAGKSPTRASLLQAATHLNEVNPFLRPGIKIVTSPRDYYPISQGPARALRQGALGAGRAARRRGLTSRNRYIRGVWRPPGTVKHA